MAIFSSSAAATNLNLSFKAFARNVEEKVGLTTGVNSGMPTQTAEDYFCSLAPTLETIVTNFETDVDGAGPDASSITALTDAVDTYGPQLFDEACKLVYDNDNYNNPDDRPLYWARIKMMVKLKSHPYLDSAAGAADRDKLVKSLEAKTRNYDGIDFSSPPAGTTKKILLLGFDPFSLDETISAVYTLPDPSTLFPIINFIPFSQQVNSGNIRKSNPSGATVLGLHGKASAMMDQLIEETGGEKAFIQSVILPVRYKDFEEGIVEDVVRPFLDCTIPGIDMIMTVSESALHEFNIDRFAAKARGGSPDNNGGGAFGGRAFYKDDAIPGSIFPFKDSFTPLPTESKIFYETTLPYTQMVNATVNSPLTLRFNQTFRYKKKERIGMSLLPTISYPKYLDRNSPAGAMLLENQPFSPVIPTQLPTTGTATFESIEGSGGRYLSNESFYRVSRMRDNLNPTFPTGHLHVPKIQRSHYDLNPFTFPPVGDNLLGEDFDSPTIPGDPITKDVIMGVIECIKLALPALPATPTCP